MVARQCRRIGPSRIRIRFPGDASKVEASNPGLRSSGPLSSSMSPVAVLATGLWGWCSLDLENQQKLQIPLALVQSFRPSGSDGAGTLGFRWRISGGCRGQVCPSGFFSHLPAARSDPGLGVHGARPQLTRSWWCECYNSIIHFMNNNKRSLTNLRETR